MSAHGIIRVWALSDRVVIGIAPSALFDLADCDAVFREQGEVDDVLDKGVAFPSSGACCR